MGNVHPLWLWLLTLGPIAALMVLYWLRYTAWPALLRRLSEWRHTRRVLRRSKLPPRTFRLSRWNYRQ